MDTDKAEEMRLDLSSGVSFERYVELWDEESRRILLEQARTPRGSAGFGEAIGRFSGSITLAVFSKVGCPDCLFLAPFLKRMEDGNPRIRIVFFRREDYLKLVLAATGVTRVPTVLPFTNGGVLLKGAFVGHPKRVDEDWEAAGDAAARRAVTQAYRSGEAYGPDLEKELLALLQNDSPFGRAGEAPRSASLGFSSQIVYLPYPDPRRAADFYERHLKLELLQASETLRLYRVSGNSLLGIVRGPRSDWGRSDASVEHPGSVAVTLVTDDAIGWHDSLRAQGVPVGDYAFMYQEKVPFRRFLINDPEGYTLEVRQFVDAGLS